MELMVRLRALLLRIVLLPFVLPLAGLLSLPFLSRPLVPLLYRDGRPTRTARSINRLWSWLASMGVLPHRWPGTPVIGPATLEVTGRRSGRPRSNMVTWVEYEGRRYFVSMLGPESDWYRNLTAAAGHAVFRHGSRRPVRLKELPVDQRAPVIQAWFRRTWTSTQRHLGVQRDAPIEEFRRIASEHPVFRIVELSETEVSS
jgi:deazaflavin-dependent oxidoreductase (nitroreductase family)